MRGGPVPASVGWRIGCDKAQDAFLMSWVFASILRQCTFLRWLLAVGISQGGGMAAIAASGDSATEQPVWPDFREAAPSSDSLTIGYVEKVAIYPGGILVTAKIDTGARTSSLDAANIQTFTKDGKEWVRFVLHGDKDMLRQVELPVERTVRIRRSGAPVQRRYVVKIGVCLGSYYKIAEVNLVNREGLNYRMLIGRTFMTSNFVIDPGAKFLTRPSCQTR